MSNNIRTFRAATADEAMAQVRRELGLEAVVFEVNKVPAGGLFGWLSSRPRYEVKAGLAARATQLSRSSANHAPGAVPSNIGTIAAAAAASKSADLVGAGASSTRSTPQLCRTPTYTGPAIPSDLDHGAERGPFERTTRENARFEACGELAPPPSLLPELPTPINRIAAIDHRLDALQQMIAELSRRPQPRGLVEIPSELFPHYLTLVEADVEDEVARDLISKLQRHAVPGQLADTAATMALLTALIEQQIPCDHSLAPVRGKRQIAMVVGPTGVGKTTTLAKLAGRFGGEEGCRIGLITVDTYRVAAVEQLRTYAEIIDLPMRIVTTAGEMQEALDAFADCDLVLIDTAGRSPHDDRRLNELKQLIDAACPDFVYLVLSLASGANALRAAADRFAAVQPTSLVLTKLDEATGCGGLLSVTRDIGLPIAYFTTGQEVPRDIEPANPCRAARLIVGTDHIRRTDND
jgi:flagellar biosynthesis protein FlhF